MVGSNRPAFLTSRQKKGTSVLKGVFTSISSTVAILAGATIIWEVIQGGNTSVEMLLIFGVSAIIALVGWARILLHKPDDVVAGQVD